MRIFILISICFLLCLSNMGILSAQASFQKYITRTDPTLFNILLSITEMDDQLIVLKDDISFDRLGMQLCFIGKNGEAFKQKSYHFNYFSPFGGNIHITRDNNVLVSAFVSISSEQSSLDNIGKNRIILVKFSGTGELLWDRILRYDNVIGLAENHSTVETESGDFILLLRGGLLLKIGQDGQKVWAKRVLKEDKFRHRHLIKVDEDSFWIVGRTIGVELGTGSLTNAIITNIDSNGNERWSKAIPEFNPWEMQPLPNGDVLLTGYSVREQKMLKILRLKPNGEPEWMRHFPVKREWEKRQFTVLPDGCSVHLFHLPKGSVLIKVDNSGEVLWAKRYSTSDVISQSIARSEEGNLITHFEDGSIAFILNNEDENQENLDMLIRTDPFGNIEGCPSVNFCIESESRPLPILGNTNITLDSAIDSDIVLHDTLNSTVTNLPLVLKDVCPKLAVPSPYFTLPDTICENTPVTPDALCQAQADTWRWEVEGQNQSSVAQPQDLTFPNIGTQQLVHIIETDGCLDTFARRVEVVAAPAFDIGQDTVLCEDAPFVWNVEQSNLQNYRWSDSLTGAARTITEGGFYTVSAEGEHCTVCASRDIAFISMLYSENPIRLGEDTTICQQLPLELEAAHPAATRYIWEDGSTDSKRDIIQTGNYGVTATIAGCPFEAEINVLSEDCTARVYVPTVFSPNGDGQNDVFEISVGDALIEQIQIYDRWGNLVYTGTPTWDGTVRGQQANAGAYIYQVEYLEVRLGARKVLEGEVLLMR